MSTTRLWYPKEVPRSQRRMLLVARGAALLDDVRHVVGRHELPLLDVDGLPGRARPRRRGRSGGTRNAGIWRTSRTRAAALGLRGLVDVGDDGQARLRLDRREDVEALRRGPGPRKESFEERLALSKDDLKTIRAPVSSPIAFSRSRHRERVLARLDDAGPGEEERRRAAADRVAGGDRDGADRGQEHSPARTVERARRLGAASASSVTAARCARAARMKSLKSGWQAKGLDFSSGWNWQPRNHGWSSWSSMISTNLLVGRHAGERQPGLLEARQVLLVDLVAVAVALPDEGLAVGARREGARRRARTGTCRGASCRRGPRRRSGRAA